MRHTGAGLAANCSALAGGIGFAEAEKLLG